MRLQNPVSQSETGRNSFATQAPGENGCFGEFRPPDVIRSTIREGFPCLLENLEIREISVKPWAQGLMDILGKSVICTTGSWGVRSGGESGIRTRGSL